MLDGIRTRGLACAGLMAIGVAATSAAQAVLLAYEPFEYGDVAIPSEGQYAVGSEDSGLKLLGGQNPTIQPVLLSPFYTGPWIQPDGDSQVVKALPSLSYPDFLPGVGGIQQETVQFDCCSFGRSGREMFDGDLGQGALPITVYEGFLIDFGTQGNDPPGMFGRRGHELWDGGIGDAFLSVELFVDHFVATDTLSLLVATDSGTQTVPVGGGGLDLATLASFNGGTHLVVMRYDFNPVAPDVVSVYLDPAGPVEPRTSDARISVPSSDLFISHHGAFTQFTFSGGTHVPGAIDEIRWATTFAEVTPLPEPGVAQAAGIGTLLLARLARRRTRNRSSRSTASTS